MFTSWMIRDVGCTELRVPGHTHIYFLTVGYKPPCYGKAPHIRQLQLAEF